MASENAKIDSNNRHTMLGVTDDANAELRRLLVDPSTGRLKVSATITGGGDVSGPASSTDNALALWDGTDGDTLKDSTVTLVTGVLAPATTDTVALGSTSLMWSDLFLASGSVINWNNGDVTLTHSNGFLTIRDGALIVEGSGGFYVGSSSPFQDSLGTLVLTNVDLLDATTEATIEAAIDTLPNLTSIQGHTVTLTGAFIRSGAHSLTLTTSGATNVTLPTSGTLVNSGVTTLSSLVSVGTITTGTWDATDIAVTAGGTGVSSLTAYAPIFGGTTATGAVQSGTVGTAGQVLTSNGAGALPTFQDAAGGGTPRRNLNIQLNTTNGQASGTTNPTDLTSINGIACGTGAVSGASSILKINTGTAATWDFYDKNPEFNVNIFYQNGSSTGDGTVWFGDTNDVTPPANSSTANGMFIMATTAAGTTSWYLVNGNGTSNTNTSLAGITSAQENLWRVVKDSTTNIKCYVNYTLKATHTTNLPSGDFPSTSFVTMGADNEAGDSTSRTCRFGFADILLDSPTG